MNSVTLEFI